MQFEIEANIQVKGLVEADEFGGYVEGYNSVGTVDSFITPVEETLVIKNDVIVKQSITKLFTKDEVPADVARVECQGRTYTVLSFTNFGKIIMLKMEELI